MQQSFSTFLSNCYNSIKNINKVILTAPPRDKNLNIEFKNIPSIDFIIDLRIKCFDRLLGNILRLKC